MAHISLTPKVSGISISNNTQGGTDFFHAHFFSVPTQGNIYTLAQLVDSAGRTKILFATLQRKVYCMQYWNGRPCIKEVPFTYIPGGAEIISIDAYIRDADKEDFVIGITIIKKDETNSGSTSQYLNMYSSVDRTSESNGLQVASQNCLHLQLSYVPYQVKHVLLPHDGDVAVVWLVCGSDGQVHIYHGDDEGHNYQETNLKATFPELCDIKGITLWVEVLYTYDNKIRYTATSGEDGCVTLSKVLLGGNTIPQVTANQTLKWDYPVGWVRLLRLPIFTPPTHHFDEIRVFDAYKHDPVLKDELPYLIVGSSVESCTVFRDLAPGEGCYLKDSEAYDVVTCCIVCDLDMDGTNEIAVGTYGQVVLIYKYETGRSCWCLVASLNVPDPILSLTYCDIMVEGSNQLVVMTLKGIHIYQYNPWKIKAFCMEKLKAIAELCDNQNNT